jgi:hypothetical protein
LERRKTAAMVKISTEVPCGCRPEDDHIADAFEVAQVLLRRD